jgi:phosphoglycolate phosphatase
VLLLFDIDGTLLLRASTEHAAAVFDAIADVWRVPDPTAHRVSAAGRTDSEIAREICLLAGVDAARIDAGMADFRIRCAESYAHRCPDDLSGFVAPGADAALDALAGREGTILSLVTGNLEPVARLKLKRAGLGRHFTAGQGGFGSDAEDRALLPAIARRRAGTLDGGRPYPRERTVVIGDTPRDIACARADGVHCIAVTTGPYRADALADADAVIASAHGLLDALAAFG